MSMMERLYQIDQILATRAFVSKDELMDRLGVSLATLKRDIAYLRDRLNAPILFDRDLGGYRFEMHKPSQGPDYKLRAYSKADSALADLPLLFRCQPSSSWI